MSQNIGLGEHIDDYEVLEMLGRGGFATVYRARSKHNNQMVAIKMIDKKLIHDAGLTNRVRQEVEIHSRLKHPFVVELYTFFQDSDYVYLVMELAANGELQRFMKEHMRRPMTENEAAAILQQVVSGILYLHSHNIMHRDISLSNLLLSKNMNVKIADFGLATQIKKNEEKHMTMCGTPNFISPEVASRASHGLPADVWAIGCLLYTLLVGRPPFDTNAVQSTLTKVVMSDYRLPDHLSFEAKDLITKLLKKDPNERMALQQIVKHPFMQRHESTASAGPVAITTYSNVSDCTNSNTALGYSASALSYNRSSSSCDSGIITFASGSTSSSFRPILRSAVINHDQPIPETQAQGQGYGTNNYAEYSNTSHKHLPNNNAMPISRCTSNDVGWMSAKNDKNEDKPHWSLSDHRGTSHCAYPSQQNFNQRHQYNEDVTGSNLHQSHGIQSENYGSNMIAGIPTITPVSSAHTPSSLNSTPTQRIPVPPLNTTRLQPTRFRNKSAIMSILKGGEVVVEFIKFRGKLNEDRITDICWISQDGRRILIYEPDPGRGLPIKNEPPELPQNDTRVGIFSYDNLPSKHWRKYLFASRFVSLVQASTPKVTYFSDQAKFHLMESMLHFEVIFYDGSKVTQSPNEGLKVYNRHGQQLQPHEHVTPTAKALLEHQSTCLKHCESICNALEIIQRNNTCGDNFSCFPVVIGRRPNRDRTGKITGNATAILRTNGNGVTKPTTLETSECRFGSYKLPLSEENDTARPIRTINLSNLGKATELLNGTIEVQFCDGSIISVQSNATTAHDSPNRITYVQTNGVATHFTANDDLPLMVREKLQHLPYIQDQLRNNNSISNFSCNDVYCTPGGQKTARMYTSTPALNEQCSSTPSIRYFR